MTAANGSDRRKARNVILTVVTLLLVAAILALVDAYGGVKLAQVFALFAIWGAAAVSLNLINGVTGILSLGHHGFMLIGGYVTALLTLPEATRLNLSESARSQLNDFTAGLSIRNWLEGIGLNALAGGEWQWLHFVIALFLGGLLAAVFGLIVGIPSLRLRGDYLAIVTFAFGEAIRLLASTSLFGPFTNGALGFAGVPTDFGKSVWWTFGLLMFTVGVMSRLKFSSYGRALMGIREDEIAAEAMGVRTSYHKVLAFVISAFFAGLAGGLWVSWVGTARLDLFLFTLTFYFLVAVSVGGTGSITGTLLGTALVVAVRQYGDPLEQSYTLETWIVAGSVALLLIAAGTLGYRALGRMRPLNHPLVLPLVVLGAGGLIFVGLGPQLSFLGDRWQGFGMRAVLLSVLLISIMIFRPGGMLGRAEFSWAWLFGERKDVPSEEERQQDAWLANPELNPGGKPAREGEGG